MSNQELLLAGLKLLIFGMGMVFIFLVIMIYAVKIMEKLLAPFAKYFEEAKAPVTKKNSVTKSDDSAAAIAAAVAVHLAKSGGAVIKCTEITVNPTPNATTSQATSENQIISPLPGTVLKVLVNANDKVSAGDTILILEAVKMENEIKAEVDGIVKEIKVSQGDTVQADDVLAVIAAN
jgi:sodium pump decarboxylase gamma subunit